MTATTAPFTTPVLCAALVAIYGMLRLNSWRRDVKRLPPGPKKLPVIDNLLDMPAQFTSEVFAAMSKRYDSDIVHLGALGQSIIILNSVKAARELLEKRSGIYSDRPHFVMVEELCGWNWTFGFYPYGDKWREERRAFQKHIGFDGKMYHPIERYYVQRLLNHFLDTPDKFCDHLRHMIGAIFISIAYGIKVRPENDPYVRLAERATRELAELATSAFLPDILPFTKHLPSWFPGIQFKEIANRHRSLSRSMREVPFEAAQELIKSGNSLPSFVTAGLEDIEEGELDKNNLELLKNVGAQIFIAGADTTYSTLVALTLALVKYPRVQKKAQEELDQALQGGCKFPEHSDILSLPYLTALVLEALRWRPVTPLGVPHATSTDDVYEGYYIPKGSTIIANQAAMLGNEEDYPNPQEFRPERFLRDGKIDEDARDSLDIAFGFGRRICPGRQVAHSTLMITVATLLSNFEFSKKKGPDGRTIEPVDGWLDGLARTQLPFECAITPRSQGAVDAIRSWAAAEE